MFHNLFFLRGWFLRFCEVWMSEAVEQLKRKVASLTKESEELQRYRRDIDWLKTLQKKVVKDGFD